MTASLYMGTDLLLRRKITLKAHGKQAVFIKRSVESGEHVLMKAFLWALYLPEYPDLMVEVPIGDRYKPDVVSLDPQGRPRFWGESGKVSRSKVESLARRYRDTHFALAKWTTRLDPHLEMVRSALHGLGRTAPFDLLSFPPDSADRFISSDGSVYLSHDDVEWTRIG